MTLLTYRTFGWECELLAEWKASLRKWKKMCTLIIVKINTYLFLAKWFLPVKLINLENWKKIYKVMLLKWVEPNYNLKNKQFVVLWKRLSYFPQKFRFSIFNKNQKLKKLTLHTLQKSIVKNLKKSSKNVENILHYHVHI